MTIKQKQNLLAYLGYYTGNIDGDWGKKSQAATIAFQQNFGGLTLDGICGAETEKALKHAVAYGMPERKTEDTATVDVWDGIKHFTRKEFKCKCGNIYCNGYPTEMKRGVLTVVERTRVHFDSPGTVSSGLRCKQHNANVGGVSNSRHLSGKAVDFCIKGKTAAQVLAFVQKQPETRYAYAIDSQFVHVDSDIL